MSQHQSMRELETIAGLANQMQLIGFRYTSFV
jgi:hypothetical protein